MLQNGPVALFFFPLASSGGCTAEMCAVRDRSAEFDVAGAQPVGISRDDVAAQAAFAAAHGLTFPLLADVDGSVCDTYGTRRNLAAAPVKRHTVVIGTDGRVTEVIKSEFRFGRHAAAALEALPPR